MRLNRVVLPEERFYGVECLCDMCGKSTVVKVRFGDYLLWAAMQQPAQDCFPYLSVPERETLISGMCSECQKKVWPDNYDDNGNWIGEVLTIMPNEIAYG